MYNILSYNPVLYLSKKVGHCKNLNLLATCNCLRSLHTNVCKLKNILLKKFVFIWVNYKYALIYASRIVGFSLKSQNSQQNYVRY